MTIDRSPLHGVGLIQGEKLMVSSGDAWEPEDLFVNESGEPTMLIGAKGTGAFTGVRILFLDNGVVVNSIDEARRLPKAVKDRVKVYFWGKELMEFGRGDLDKYSGYLRSYLAECLDEASRQEKKWLYAFGSPFAKTYTKACVCGELVELSTQDESSAGSEYTTEVHARCHCCGRGVGFTLPVN